MRLRIGQSSIAIERGDITDWEVDAIINAANSTLAMGTGVAGAIKRKAASSSRKRRCDRAPSKSARPS